MGAIEGCAILRVNSTWTRHTYQQILQTGLTAKAKTPAPFKQNSFTGNRLYPAAVQAATHHCPVHHLSCRHENTRHKSKQHRFYGGLFRRGCNIEYESDVFGNLTYRFHRVGQNRIYALYMTAYLAISLPIIPYIHRIYRVLANATYGACSWTAVECRFSLYYL